MGGAKVMIHQGGGVASMGPLVAMIVVQVGYAGMNIIVKVAMESGMNPFILVAYRQIFATVAITPFAYFLERRTRPTITKKVLLQIFFCALFGATGNQITYYVGLKNSTPTIACALSNILPAVTFLLAIPFGLESVRIRTKAGQAKIIGTTICISGAMLLSFYHGPLIRIQESKLHWGYADEIAKLHVAAAASTNKQGNFFLGPFLLLISSVSWAVWFIIQAKMGADFDAPYTSTAILSFISTLQSVLAALCFDYRSSSWSLYPPIRLAASLYAGIIASALGFALMSWSIQKKGPLFVSVFSPLLLVIVALLSWALLKEKIYVGTLVGSALIVFGLYVVLWGKNKELKENMSHVRLREDIEKEEAREGKISDLEMQPSGKVLYN